MSYQYDPGRRFIIRMPGLAEKRAALAAHYRDLRRRDPVQARRIFREMRKVTAELIEDLRALALYK